MCNYEVILGNVSVVSFFTCNGGAFAVQSCLVARKKGIVKGSLNLPKDVGEAHSERRDLTRNILDP